MTEVNKGATGATRTAAPHPPAKRDTLAPHEQVTVSFTFESLSDEQREGIVAVVVLLAKIFGARASVTTMLPPINGKGSTGSTTVVSSPESSVKASRDDDASVAGGSSRSSNPPPVDFTQAGPFGKCPKCGQGEVRRLFHPNGATYKHHLACSERKWNDAQSCQWSVWSEDDQRAFLATTNAKSEASPLSHVALANKVVEALRDLEMEQRAAILGEYGYARGSSFVVFCNGLSDKQLNEIIKRRV